MSEELATADLLSDHLDAVVMGELTPAPSVAPTIAETVARFFAVDDAPAPPPGLADHLWEELMHAHTIPVARESGAQLLSDGRVSVPWTGLPRVPRPLQSHGVLSQLATAALLLLVIVGSFFAFGPGRLGQQTPLPAILPAGSETPATPQPGVVETVLVDTSTATPAGPTGIWVYAYVMKPGAISPNDGAVGGLVFEVDQGAVTITVDDADRVLHAGESWNVYSQTGYTIENTSTNDAHLVIVELIDQLASSRKATVNGPFLDGMSGSWANLVEGAPNLPGGLSQVTVKRLTLAPGAALPTYTQAGLDWLGIDAGRLTVKLEGERLPFRWKSGAERTFGMGQIPPVFPVGSQVTLRNAGEDPLVLNRLTLTPTDGSESPAATPAP